MSGGVPPSSRAGKRRPQRALDQAERAADLYERFTGMTPRAIGSIDVPALPDAVAVMGECDGVLYTTVRDGKVERYIHEFADDDKPLLCVTPDGTQILLVGGRYDWTERGIVDHSDPRFGRAGKRSRR
jgi:hypothetical protein